MKIIGITGGVGCGKSRVLDYIESEYRAYVLKADELAQELKLPGQACYDALVSLLGEDVLEDTEDRRIDNRKMAQKIFSDPQMLQQVNAIMHPAVKSEILKRIENCADSGEYDYFILEAALLIEEGYMEIVDQMWYIYADEQIRRERLKESRGYSDDKISAIMKSQLTEEEFRNSCQVIINNSGDWEQTKKHIDQAIASI